MNIEDKARKSSICAGCGNDKQTGLIVCWNCFKYRQDITPFKPFYENGGGNLVSWLNTIPAKSQNWKMSIAQGTLSA